MFSLKTLGPPSLLVRGEPVRLFRKTLALFAFLGLESSRAHERAALADLFWPDLPGSKDEHSLSQALYSLRKILEPSSSDPFFLFDRKTVRFNPKYGSQIDGVRLLSPPAGCSVYHDSERCRSCAEQMTPVLREIRGPFLNGLSLPDCEEFESWSTAMGERLFARCRSETLHLISLCEREGNRPEAIVLLESVLKMNPLDESLARLLMTLHATDGNFQAACLVYESIRKNLREEIDLEPEEETEFLARKIRSGKATNMESVSFPVREASSPFSFERRPATALYIEIFEEGETENIPSRETGAFLGMAMEKARELGGVVIRTHGNSFLSFFGLKSSPEGAVRKAARTALELQDLLRKGEDGKTARMNLRGGIHVGKIFQGASLVSPDPGGSVSRPAISLAMQAREGEILLAKSSVPLLKGEFLTAPSEEVRILGESREGVRLLGFQGKETIVLPRKKKPCPLFGRKKEQKLFRDLLEKESGGILIVEGEAGIGKTALVRSFVDVAVSRNRLVHMIECYPQYADSPYFPLIRLMREWVSLPEECGREDGHSRILAYVRSLDLPREEECVALLGSFFSLESTPDYPSLDLPPAAMRERISNLLLSVFKRRGEKGDVFLLVEDLHWMDPSTSDLLFRIVSDQDLRKNALIVMTTRSGEGPDWLGSVSQGRSIRMTPLGEENSRKMVHYLGGKIFGRSRSRQWSRSVTEFPFSSKS